MGKVLSSSKHGLRGSDFENRINLTIDYYREKKLALIQKIPTPIVPVKLGEKKGQISLAYFDKQSTVDYIGLVQEIPVCFDAKETHFDNRIPLQNIHVHQYNFMKEFEEQGGVSFLLINFSLTSDVYYLPFKKLSLFLERSKNTSKKSIYKEELDADYIIHANNTLYIDFLKCLQKDINER